MVNRLCEAATTDGGGSPQILAIEVQEIASKEGDLNEVPKTSKEAPGDSARSQPISRLARPEEGVRYTLPPRAVIPLPKTPDAAA